MTTLKNDVKYKKDVFMTCSMCQKQLKDARRLPCTHRFCFACLDNAFRVYRNKNGSKDPNFPCPECEQTVVIPQNGAVSVKRDLWVNEMLELEELKRKVVSDNQYAKCDSCSTKSVLVAICSDCNGFICKHCSDLHESLGVLKTHNNIYRLDEKVRRGKRNIDLKRLVTFTTVPKCQKHPQLNLEICCKSCNNLLICLKCALMLHGNHEKEDVEQLSRRLRADINLERSDLYHKKQMSLQCQNQNTIMSGKMDAMFENIISGIENKYEVGMERCKEEDHILTSVDGSGIEKLEESKNADVQKYEREAEVKIEAVKKEMMARISKINDDLNQLVYNRSKNAQNKINAIEITLSSRRKVINAKRQKLSDDRDKLLKIIQSSKQTASTHLQECNQSIDNILESLAYINENVEVVLDVSSDWSFAETASDLVANMRKLKNSLDDIRMSSHTMETPTLSFDPAKDNVSIGKLALTICRQFKVLPAGIFMEESWLVDNVAAESCDSIFIAGRSKTKRESVIQCLSTDGKVIFTKNFQAEVSDLWSLCKASDHYLVTCRRAQIDVLSSNNGEIIRQFNLRRMSRWRGEESISSVAYDKNMNEIIICKANSNEVFVFDQKLKFLRTFKIPGPNRGSFSLAMNDDMLLVCAVHKPGYAMAVDLGTTHIITRYQPIEEEHEALGICSDSDNLVYILWKPYCDVCVVQYTNQGQPLIGVPVHPDAQSITTVKKRDGSEHLVVTTRDGRLALYSLPLRKSGQSEICDTWFSGITDATLEGYLSQRFHWQPTMKNYGLKESCDFDLTGHVTETTVVERRTGMDHTLLV